MENKRVDLDKYLSSFTDDIRTLARDLRNKILKLESDLDEVIKWNNLIYKKMDWYVQLLYTKIMLT